MTLDTTWTTTGTMQSTRSRSSTKPTALPTWLLALALLLPMHLAATPNAALFCSGFEDVDCMVTNDVDPPVFSDIEPDSSRALPGERPMLGVRIEDGMSGVDADTLRFFHDDVDVTASASWQDSRYAYTPAIAPTPGLHEWRVLAIDLAGNSAEFRWRYQIATAPELSEVEPVDGARLEAGALRIRARITDATIDLPTDGVSLFIDDVAVDLGGSITRVDSRTLLLDHVPPQPLVPADHRFLLRVSNSAQVTTHIASGFWIEEAPIHMAEFVSPDDGAHTREALAKIVVRANANRTDVASVLINGEQADWEGDAAGEVVRFRFVPLSPGPNVINAIVGFADGELRTISRTIHLDAPPRIEFDSPTDLATLGPSSAEAAGGATDLTGNVAHPVRVTGRIDVPVQSVTINQQLATLAGDGRSFVFERYFLHEGHNILTAEASTADGRHATNTISVYVDHTAPLLTVEAPASDASVNRQRTDIRGQVVDVVSGLDRTPEPEVYIRDLATGDIREAEVDQQFFIARGVPLVVGINRFELRAVDASGNERRVPFELSRIAGTGSVYAAVGGDAQTGLAGSVLPRPLAVSITNADGNPVVDEEVVFAVVRGDGALRLVPDQALVGDGVNPARHTIARTDSNGHAQVYFQLGTETGLAANAVVARRAASAEEVDFSATVLASAVDQVLVDGATGFQYAPVGSPVVELMAVVLLDADHNRIENAPVQFEIMSGDARFPAGPGTTDEGRRHQTVTDRNGRAVVRPIAGIIPGTSQIRARSLAGTEQSPPAMFEIVAMATTGGPTAFSGIIQDHTGAPIEGVTVSIGRTTLATTSDAEGRFVFADGVPPGKVDLFIDGRMVVLPNGGTYPGLHFEVPVIDGVENQLPHPIYLPPMDLAQAAVVGGDQDVSLTIPGFEGLELIVKANSATFPDGSRIGPLLLSPVHADKLPMVPPGGSASFGPLAWTIQPSGTRFDPPIEVRLPNTGGLRVGETVSIVQWDHDLAMFVPMGQGTVNESGTQIVSNPGSGITKAGWGGCTGDCPPPPPNCGSSDDGPRPPGYQEIRAFNLRKAFFGFIELEDPVELDRISKNHKTRFKDKTFRLVNGFWDSDRCDSVRIDWLFGDGGSGTGETVDHQYEERGPTTVRETIHCFYTSRCDGQPKSKQWAEDFPIRRRDTRWIEYREALDECGWTPGCWIHVNAMESLDQVAEDMGQLEIEWLTDLKSWNRETLDMMGPGSGSVPPPGKLATLAFLHAANETVFPTTILDVFPVGKATKALKILRGNYNISPSELKHLSQEVAQACSIVRQILTSRACSVAWQRFELVGLDAMAVQKCPFGCLKKWQPVRNTNNGFDGAAIWRDPFGKLQLSVTESKMWAHATSPVQASDLTAFGFGADASTLQRNLDQVINDLRLDPNFSAADIDDLALRLNGNPRPFDIFIHVLHENRLDWGQISAQISSLTGRAPIQIHSWQP